MWVTMSQMYRSTIADGIRGRTATNVAVRMHDVGLRAMRRGIAGDAIPLSESTSDVGQRLRRGNPVVHLDEFARTHTRGQGFGNVVADRLGYFVKP